ncbi:hypothetical protein TWF696_001077 [Orbilia brochopaga]|uniref:Uncharacterized protein n=1 Tax=Orbilia brochopaga TaxID=3140254 RepID=A0AAV9VEF9_9PEZI
MDLPPSSQGTSVNVDADVNGNHVPLYASGSHGLAPNRILLLAAVIAAGYLLSRAMPVAHAAVLQSPMASNQSNEAEAVAIASGQAATLSGQAAGGLTNSTSLLKGLATQAGSWIKSLFPKKIAGPDNTVL